MLWYREQCLKISGLFDENCARGTHLKLMLHPHNGDSELAFVQGITFDDKLMNLCEIWLFHVVLGVSKGTRDNYHEIW